MERLKGSIKRTKQYFGRLDVKWGDIQRLKRGNTNLPLSGGPDILEQYIQKETKGREKQLLEIVIFRLLSGILMGKFSQKAYISLVQQHKMLILNTTMTLSLIHI